MVNFIWAPLLIAQNLASPSQNVPRLRPPQKRGGLSNSQSNGTGKPGKFCDPWGEWGYGKLHGGPQNLGPPTRHFWHRPVRPQPRPHFVHKTGSASGNGPSRGAPAAPIGRVVPRGASRAWPGKAPAAGGPLLGAEARRRSRFFKKRMGGGKSPGLIGNH